MKMKQGRRFGGKHRTVGMHEEEPGFRKKVAKRRAKNTMAKRSRQQNRNR